MELGDYMNATREFNLGWESWQKSSEDFLVLRDICLCKMGLSINEYYEKAKTLK